MIEFVEANDSPFRQIHEVYYDDDGKPTSYGENPAAIVWDVATNDNVTAREILQNMKQALDKPVLVETDFYT